MNDNNTATLRTTWNGALVTAFIIALANVIGWEIEVADLAPFLPVLIGIIAIFYRLSLIISETWPKAGFVLFGKKAAPAYGPPKPPA